LNYLLFEYWLIVIWLFSLTAHRWIIGLLVMEQKTIPDNQDFDSLSKQGIQNRELRIILQRRDFHEVMGLSK